MLGSPLSLTVGESLVATVLTGILVILIGLVRPFVDEDGRPQPLASAAALRASISLGGLTIVAALARLYRPRALPLGADRASPARSWRRCISASCPRGPISEEGAFADTRRAAAGSAASSLDETTLDQLGLVVSIAINLLVVVIGLPLILFLWGFQPGDIRPGPTSSRPGSASARSPSR